MTKAYNQMSGKKFAPEKMLMGEETYEGILETFDGVQVRFGAGGARCRVCPLALTCVAVGMRFRLLLCGRRWGSVRVRFTRSEGETDRGYCSRMTPFPCIYTGEAPPIPDFSTSCNKCLTGARMDRWCEEAEERKKPFYEREQAESELRAEDEKLIAEEEQEEGVLRGLTHRR